MQLTPRNLILACGALLLGGVAVSVVTTLAPSTSLDPAAAAGGASAPVASASESGLGDEEISYPATAVPTPSVTASPIQAPASVAPTLPAAATSPASDGAGDPASARRTRPAVTPDPRSTAAARPASPAARPRAATNPDATGRAVVRTVSSGGWRAPALHVGANAITLPHLTSGAAVRVTVACTPSRACTLSGNDLVIDATASAVTVTWRAPARGGFTAWQVSRVL